MVTVLVHVTDFGDFTFEQDIEITITLTFTSGTLGVLNSPPFFKTSFFDLILLAGESSLYVFPKFDDLDTGDILTPSLELPGG